MDCTYFLQTLVFAGVMWAGWSFPGKPSWLHSCTPNRSPPQCSFKVHPFPYTFTSPGPLLGITEAFFPWDGCETTDTVFRHDSRSQLATTSGLLPAPTSPSGPAGPPFGPGPGSAPITQPTSPLCRLSVPTSLPASTPPTQAAPYISFSAPTRTRPPVVGSQWGSGRQARLSQGVWGSGRCLTVFLLVLPLASVQYGLPRPGFR